MCKVLKAIRSVQKVSKTKRAAIALSSCRLSYIDYEAELVIGQDRQGDLLEFSSVDELELELSQSSTELQDTLDDVGVRGEYIGTLTDGDVKSMLWASIACDVNTTRYTLGGVFLDRVHMIATDGRRMHIAKIEGSLNIPTSENAIVPKEAVKALSELMKLFKEKSVLVTVRDKSKIVFLGDKWEFSARLIQGRFPAWEDVVPRKLPSSCDLTKDDLETCDREIRVAALKNKFDLSKLTRKERENFCEQPPIIEVGAGKVPLDCRYVLEANLTSFLYVDDCSPVLFGWPESRQAVIMPLGGNRK